MEKNIYIFFLLLAVILLTGCSNNKVSYQTEQVNYSTQLNNSNSNNNSLEKENNTHITISSFSTNIYDKSDGRMHNLRLASEKLTGIAVQSGETFSFNDSIGPYNKENGFEKGKIFSSKGDVLEEYGGGICQISTTLYNALLPLNVEIIERNNHSKKVQYIENGKDAAISYGHLDFKFKNTTDYSIKFVCTVTENEVKVEIKKAE